MHEISIDQVHRYTKQSWSTCIGGQDGALSLAGDMYWEVDIPSPLEVSIEASVELLRAIST